MTTSLLKNLECDEVQVAQSILLCANHEFPQGVGLLELVKVWVDPFFIVTRENIDDQAILYNNHRNVSHWVKAFASRLQRFTPRQLRES